VDPLNPAGAVALLDEDPELGAALGPDELEHARRLVVVPILTVDVGPWEAAALEHEPSLGLLLLDGLLTVNVQLGDRVASQLAGPGDVLHGSTVPDALLPATVTHVVSERARLAVLDRRFIAAVRRWPALLLALHERMRVQERRQAVHAAIGKLRRVEDRVLALLWHLAERWGRVTTDGVVLPLSLTHETIGRLAGAERPTVSLALTELARIGDVTRRPDGAFVLRETSRDKLEPTRAGHGQARPLRAVRTPEPAATAADVPAPRPPLVDIVALRRRIAALHEDLPERTREIEETLATSRARTQRSTDLRARVASDRDQRTSD